MTTPVQGYTFFAQKRQMHRVNPGITTQPLFQLAQNNIDVQREIHFELIRD